MQKYGARHSTGLAQESLRDLLRGIPNAVTLEDLDAHLHELDPGMCTVCATVPYVHVLVCIVFCILSSIDCLLYTYCLLHPVFWTQYCLLYTVFRALYV